MKAFIICTVRSATAEYKEELERYVKLLENQGHIVHLPHRDTNQTGTGIQICTENMDAIKESDQVHVFYNNESRGTHFDMGVAFALDKPIVIVENEKFNEGKSYAKMLEEWAINGKLNHE